MPVMGGGHGDAGVYGPQVRDHQGGGAFAAGDRAAGQDDIALQPAAVELEDLGPENQLHVALLVLDGHEHATLLPLGVDAHDLVLADHLLIGCEVE